MTEKANPDVLKAPTTPIGVQEARSRANQIVLSELISLVGRDSATDLSMFFRKEAVEYPCLVDEFIGAFDSVFKDKRCNGNAQPSIATGFLDLPVDGSAEITRPLDQSVLNLAHATQMSYAAERSCFGCGSFVIEIGPSHVVKIDPSLDPDHIDNLQYLATRIPELPIPRSLGVLRSGEMTYLFMSRGLGTTLESVWPQLSTTQKTSVKEQLNSIFRLFRDQMLENYQSGVRLGSFISGVCKDKRMFSRTSSEGLRTETEFNDFLFQHPQKTVGPWIKTLRQSMREDYRIVMTHGDLHPRNIMASLEESESSQTETEASKTEEKTIRVSSIIDWEIAGWYPESWEFVKAMTNCANTRGPLRDWINFIPTDAIGSFPMEYDIDRLLGEWVD